MVAQQSNPPGQPGSFSPDVERELAAALREPWIEGTPPEALIRALRRAASEAREKMLRAEEMLIAFKELERRVAADPSAVPTHAIPSRVIRALIEAYYFA